MQIDSAAQKTEILDLFIKYEEALVSSDLAALHDFFWDSPLTLRYGVSDQQYGIEEITKWRAEQPPLPPGRSISDTRVTTFGENTAVVNTLFQYPNGDQLGRQSQTWIRLEGKWKIVSAHVSMITPTP